MGGYFVWEPSRGGPLLLVAGGSGVVPFRAMLRHLVDEGGGVPATLLASSRSWDDVIYRDELERLDGEGLRVVHTLTREQPTTGTATHGAWTPRCSPRSAPTDERRTCTSAARRRSSRLSRLRSWSSATSRAASAPNASDPQEDEMRLDGNAAAGILRQVFAVEMTEAIGTWQAAARPRRSGRSSSTTAHRALFSAVRTVSRSWPSS